MVRVSGRARLRAANPATSLGVDDPSSLPSGGELGDEISVCV